MSIISARNLGLSFGARDIFSGISVDLPNDGKVGLVGPNGVGKTSLLRILAGISPPTTGTVHRAQGTRIGYLYQEAVEAFVGHDHTLYDEMLTAFAHVHALAARLQEMEARMAAGETTDELLAAYGAAQDAFEHAGGYDYDVRIAQVLEGLGFPRAEWETPVSYLSGGQKTRALLARLLLEQPNLLILDEPTNHLDLEAVEWLENTLRAWQGAVLVASHDRYFLDRVLTPSKGESVNHIWEMSPTHIDTYRGTYSAYVQQRQERWERNQDLFEAEKERLEKEIELIRRYFAWRKFDEAKGRLKRLSRELVAIEQLGILGLQGKSWTETGVHSVHMMSIEEAHRRIKEIKPPMTRPPMLRMRLKPAGRGGTIVLRTKGLQVGYSGIALFDAGDLEVERLERVALIGPNGSGKTTFLRTVLGQLEPVAGAVKLGGGLKIGYFAQAQDALNPDNTVLDELLRHREMLPAEARQYLAQYLFRGEDVWKPVGALSGGERARLALAILALEGVNVLLLDEPTNHLDIPAQEVLQEGLERFEGTLLMVSHDRYLVDRLATQIWELRDGRLHVFKGTYQEFLAEREREALSREARSEAATQQRQAPQARNRQETGEREARKRAQTLAALESQIAQAEAALAEYSRQLQESGEAGDFAEMRHLADAYATAQAQLDGLMAEWTALAAQCS